MTVIGFIVGLIVSTFVWYFLARIIGYSFEKHPLGYLIFSMFFGFFSYFFFEEYFTKR